LGVRLPAGAGDAPHCNKLRKYVRIFGPRDCGAIPGAKNQAFRFNLFAAGRQKGFPLQSFAPHGLTFGLNLLTVGCAFPGK
jgi:hypothetical protein